MTDSVQILDAGWQMPLNTSTGLPLTDGIILFFVAGTTTPLTVYSNEALSTSLGVSVSCNSSGYPISGGSTKTLIYTGTAAYKIRITSVIGGGTIAEFDNVKGAVNTSSFLTAATAARKSVVAETSNRAVGLSDLGKIINVNCTAGALTMTIGAAATLADGWWVGIRHDGTANQVKITGNGTDTFGLNGVNVTSFSLTGRGHVVYIVCNGTSFKIDGEVPALIGNTVGAIVIADRLSAPPGSPTPGARYIVTSAPSGAWSTFAEHDIAEATGSATWFRYTPVADCGWMAYVQDEDRYYSMIETTWKETAVNIGSLTAATAVADADNFVIERSGVSLKAPRAIVTGNRFITSGTVTVASQLNLTIPADCDEMEISLWNWRPATDNADLWMRFSQSSTFLSGASDYAYGYCRGGATATAGADAKIAVADAWGNVTAEIGSIKIRIARPSASAFTKAATWSGYYTNLNGNPVETIGGGALMLNANAIDGVRFLYNSGNISTGYYTVHAIRTI